MVGECMSKRLFLFLTGMGLSLCALSQNITVADLVKLTKCREPGCFISYAAKKGFALKDSVKQEVMQYYFTDKNKINEFPPSVSVIVTFTSPDSVECGVSAADKIYYRSLKSEMNKNKFIPAEMDSSEAGFPVVWYQSQQYPGVKISVGHPTLFNDADNKPEYYTIVAHNW